MGAPRFFYDVGSPYAWLAAERVEALLGPVTWEPVLLGGIFAASGRSSWARTPARAEGIAEVERRARDYGLPRPVWPDPWPNDGLLAMRMATAATAAGAGRAFALAALRGAFAEGRVLSDPAELEVVARAAGLEPRALAARAASPATKAALRARTDAALALGVIGVPTVASGGAPVWGDDRLGER
jgi:2-hydroxychromene-2-carboxylate isomerase